VRVAVVAAAQKLCLSIKKRLLKQKKRASKNLAKIEYASLIFLINNNFCSECLDAFSL
jgi:hypothetical protein